MEVDRFLTAAETAFTDELSSLQDADIGLLFVQGEPEPVLVYDGGATAVSLSPLVCADQVVSGRLNIIFNQSLQSTLQS